MEERESSKPDKGRTKKKIQLSGGGIAGLLVVGGAFAVAALLANKTGKKRPKSKPNEKNQQRPVGPVQKLQSSCSTNEEGGAGLLSLLESAAPSVVESHRCRRINLEHGVSSAVSADINSSSSSETVETQIMEERLDFQVKSNGNREIVAVSSKVLTLPTSGNINITTFEGFNKEDQGTGENVESEPSEILCVHQYIQIEAEDRSEDSLSTEEVALVSKNDITSQGIMNVEENPQVQLNDNDYDEDSDNDNDGDDEKDREGSEATGDSSMESNADAVWPAESLEEELLLLKDMKSQLGILEHKFDEEPRKVFQEEESKVDGTFGMKEQRIALMQHPMLMLSRIRFDMWAMLAAGLLLLLLAHAMFYHPYSSQMSSQ